MKPRLPIRILDALSAASARVASGLQRFTPRAAPLLLDFAGQQQRSRAPGLIAIALAGVVFALVLLQSDMNAERIAALEAELLTLGIDRQAERLREGRKPKRSGDLDDRVKKANNVIRLLSPPWEDVFRTVEALNGKDISVLSLEPDPNSAQVRIGAEARNAQAMIDYLERLRTSETLSPAILQSHQIMSEDPNKPIRFSFTASWISARNASN